MKRCAPLAIAALGLETRHGAPIAVVKDLTAAEGPFQLVMSSAADNHAQVSVEQSKAMDRALSKAGKAHQFILIEGADHQMSRESDRTTLVTALEKFLSVNLGPGAQAPH
jgi:hypothetical protein